MSLDDPVLSTTVHATLDAAGRLVAADRRLIALNAGAGGMVGAPLAVPALAKLVRLALRLGIPVARTVIVADGGDDLDLWARADPIADGDRKGVDLILVGWRLRDPWQPAASQETRDEDFLRSAAHWVWETDSALALTHLSARSPVSPDFDGTTVLGQPLTRLFALAEDDVRALPILSGLALRQPFDRQRATVRQTGQAVQLSAMPRTDAQGAFCGFIGTAICDDAPDRAVTDTLLPPTPHDLAGFTGTIAERLDRTLRVPLGRIIATAETIRAQADGPLRPDYADYAADIANAGRHLVGLVDDLVDLQTIELPGFTILPQPVDLAEIARRATGMLRMRASSARVQIDGPSAEQVVRAMGNARRALQIVVNLIANAVRYSPLDGMIWIRVEREGHFAAIIVGDQGKGIAAVDQARIFNKFERVDPHEAGGSGLGLYIARRLARAMGGDVTVDSAPGQGARFVFTLPRDASDMT